MALSKILCLCRVLGSEEVLQQGCEMYGLEELRVKVRLSGPGLFGHVRSAEKEVGG